MPSQKAHKLSPVYYFNGKSMAKEAELSEDGRSQAILDAIRW